VATYYPQLPNAGKITIGEMLRHRSGLHNITIDSLYTTYINPPKSEADMVAIMARQKSDFEPDESSPTSVILILCCWVILLKN
jgi:D-alanyl-D-alanine carboxypeptidase